MRFKCKSCSFSNVDNSTCGLTGLLINPEEDYCSKHQYDLDYCSNCRKPLFPSQIYIFNDLILCEQCCKSMTTCAGCVCGHSCEFETNPDNMPKMIQQQIRQGNMVAMQTVKNPARIDKYCKSCECWNNEYENCMKNINGCLNYKFIIA